jgi:predicted RNA binding protein with dsRBD fold (UPF0201 family)
VLVVRAEAEVRPTEEAEKVLKAVLNLLAFSENEIKFEDLGNGFLMLIGESRRIAALIPLHSLARRDRVLDTLRKYMLSNLSGNTMTLKFHKQTAYAGHISLLTYDDESPLGPIIVTISSDKIRDIIDWLAPRTSRGVPLWENEVPDV